MSNNSLNNNSFDCALRSPFSEIYHTAISPPAVLCNDREATYSLSLNGFIKLQSHYHKSVFRSMFFWPVKPHTTTAACFLLPALRQVHLEGDRTAFPPYSLGSVSQRRSSERHKNKGSRNKDGRSEDGRESDRGRICGTEGEETAPGDECGAGLVSQRHPQLSVRSH